LHKYELYKHIYSLANKIPKRDRFGIWMRVESLTLEAYENVINAAFLPKPEKQVLLKRARIKIEILKRLVRLAREAEYYRREAVS